MVEYEPLSPAEIQELRLKEARNELTPEDTMRFIASTRARFLSRPVKATSAAAGKKSAPKGPAQEEVDFI